MKKLEKYLWNIKCPEFDPGPFEGQLKAELKQHFLRQRKPRLLPILNYTFMGLLLLTCSLLIVKPQAALKLNEMAFNKQDNLDYLLLNPEQNNSVDYEDQLQTVSSNESPLDMIEQDKSYIVHKLKDESNRTVIYISEVKKKVEPKVLY